ASQRSRMVGKARVISTSAPSRTATTDGPRNAGRHTRPANAALAGSSGKTDKAVRGSAVMEPDPPFGWTRVRPIPTYNKVRIVKAGGAATGGPARKGWVMKRLFGGGHDTAEAFPVQHSEEEWRAKLAPGQYQVLRKHGTERAGSSPLNQEK